MICYNRMAEIIALPLAAPVALKKIELRAGFYPFRNNPMVQALSDVDHCVHHRLAFRVCCYLLHERLIDLKRIYRKTSQISEAGIARAKVVDGKPYAHSLQRK